MPLLVSIDHASRLVLQRGEDPIALPDDVFAALDAQARGGGWAYPTLSDFSRVQDLPDTMHLHAFLDHVAELSRTYGRRGPVALVVPNNLALFGMFRMYSALGDNRRADIQAFRTVEEAEAWLATHSALMEGHGA